MNWIVNNTSRLITNWIEFDMWYSIQHNIQEKGKVFHVYNYGDISNKRPPFLTVVTAHKLHLYFTIKRYRILCTVLMCFLRFQFSPNVCRHIWHSKGFRFSCTDFICLLRWAGDPNKAAQSWDSEGRIQTFMNEINVPFERTF